MKRSITRDAIGRNSTLTDSHALSGASARNCWWNTLDRLDGFQRFVERVVQLAVLGNAATEDRLEIGEVCDIDDLVYAMDKRAHCVIGGEA